MGLLDLFKSKKKQSNKPTTPKPGSGREKKSPKELATKKGESFFEVVDFDFDPQNPTEGSFELDWNDQFVKELRAAGYQGQTDEEVVDNYFTNVCRNIVLETYENELADPTKRQQVGRRDLGDGRTEYS